MPLYRNNLLTILNVIALLLLQVVSNSSWCHSFTRWATSQATVRQSSLVDRFHRRDAAVAFTTASLPSKKTVASKTSTASAQSSIPQHLCEVVAHSPVLGGDIIRIRTGPDEDDTGYLTALGVPTFAVLPQHFQETPIDNAAIRFDEDCKPKRLGLEAMLQNPNAFLLTNALSSSACESILNLCENDLGFGNYQAGKNNHGAMQIIIPKEVANLLLSVIGPHVNLEGVTQSKLELQNKEVDSQYEKGQSYSIAGINRRLRVYRYAPNENESFAPHIDAGFPPGGVSLDDTENTPLASSNNQKQPFLLWDASDQYSQTSEVVSRLTVLIYLNEDFSGGHTKFYSPQCEQDRALDWIDENVADKQHDNDPFEDNVIASVQPKAGSILIFPQAVSEEAVERARYLWPLHEGSPVTSGRRPKYVIRTDVLFETNPSKQEKLALLPKDDQRLFQHDEAVRNVFLPRSPAFSSLFLHHVRTLYNPHMGGKL